ncbi:MAG: TIGR03546 family protein [Bacteroidota bacterium]
MFWLTIIKDIIKIFRAGQNPAQVAGGFALGAILGFSPMLTLQGVLVWLVLLIINVNLGAAFLAITLCTLFAYLLDPFFHWLGYSILVNIDGLRALWTSLYSAPIAPLTRFNNSVVMGSFVFALVALVPIYFGMKKAVVAYRTHVGEKMEKWKIFQVLKQSALVKWYEKVRSLGGE